MCVILETSSSLCFRREDLNNEQRDDIFRDRITFLGDTVRFNVATKYLFKVQTLYLEIYIRQCVYMRLCIYL